VRSSALASALRDQLAPGQLVFGIVDAAQCTDLAFEASIVHRKRTTTLFLPELESGLADVAPYVVPIEEDDGYLDNWARRWGTNAGVLLSSSVDLEATRAHLRKVFVVQDDQDQEFFFRFYDPRVLRSFLPTCSGSQLAEFFGPLVTFFVEAEDPSLILVFTLGSAGLQTRTVEVAV
jgi:hypothetical protein